MNGDPSLGTAIIQTDPRVAMALIALFSALVVGSAVSDLRRYVIPNWISAAIALLWCLWAVVAPGNPGTSLLIGLGVFAAGTVLFAFRAIGGGDAKLLAAVSLWAGSPEILTLIFQIAIAGGSFQSSGSFPEDCVWHLPITGPRFPSKLRRRCPTAWRSPPAGC